MYQYCADLPSSSSSLVVAPVKHPRVQRFRGREQRDSYEALQALFSCIRDEEIDVSIAARNCLSVSSNILVLGSFHFLRENVYRLLKSGIIPSPQNWALLCSMLLPLAQALEIFTVMFP